MCRRERDTHRRGAGHAVTEDGMAGDELGFEAGCEDERDGCETMGRSHGGQVGGSYKSEREKVTDANDEQAKSWPWERRLSGFPFCPGVRPGLT